ncbi:MAG: glycosyltransferase family 4 protein [Candidatus Sericytochromatia bacterium]|nr:glycosyltransferase family 4 protein [Candidatus Sericytochromatia bacterium]
MRIALLCPIFPPAPGGLADHSARWAEAMSAHLGHEIWVITGPGASEPEVPGVYLAPPFEDWGVLGAQKLLQALVNLKPDLVVVQYVPHLYHRRGFSLGFACSILRLMKAGVPVITLAHELYFARHEAWRHQPAGLVQRAALWPLFTASRRVIFSVPQRERRMRTVFPQFSSRFVTLPVGSTLPVATESEGRAWRQERGISPHELVLLFQGGAHPSKELVSVQRSIDILCDRGIPARLVSIGGCQFEGPACLSLGHVSQGEAQRILRAADMALAPFSDGASGRRGSLLNALSAGLPTVSTRGSDTELSWFPPDVIELVSAGEPALFAEAVLALAQSAVHRQALGHSAKVWFDERFSWPVLAAAWEEIFISACPQAFSSPP